MAAEENCQQDLEKGLSEYSVQTSPRISNIHSPQSNSYDLTIQLNNITPTECEVRDPIPHTGYVRTVIRKLLKELFESGYALRGRLDQSVEFLLPYLNEGSSCEETRETIAELLLGHQTMTLTHERKGLLILTISVIPPLMIISALECRNQ